ncbi:hypothetical protein tb265_26080 [Gemmatimonadetes bacterium T265]|nr:hypothetical protein tb265_26080 [Gemmatimonadetes bacterium T265]
MPPTPPTYTPASANAALPYVRRVVADLVRDHADWRASVAALAAVEAAPGGDPDAPALRRRAARLADDVRAALADLAALGVECKGLDVGLVDFPAVVDGVPAYLCWQLGEPTVAWWHRRDAGFAGRRLIAAPEAPAVAPAVLGPEVTA